MVLSVAFSPDGKHVLTAGGDNIARLWEVASGKERRHFEGSNPVAFSPDGKRVFTGSNDTTARIWDVLTGKAICTFTGHSGRVWAAAFTPDGKRVVTTSLDGTARLWDCATGRELCQLAGFRDGTWAVLDPAGRYDSSNGGDIEWVHGVLGNVIVPLKQFKGERYDPGLLAKYMGFNKEPVRTLQAPK
jgi:WD40 repeat protein